MRNITGSPVERTDFFDRPRDLARLQRELSNGANLLLTAPRRVGKTSLVLRLCELERAAGSCQRRSRHRKQVRALRRQYRSPLRDRRCIIEDPDAASVRAQHEILRARMDDHVVVACRGQVCRQANPVIAVVMRDEHTGDMHFIM